MIRLNIEMNSYIKNPFIITLPFLLFFLFSPATWAIGVPSAVTATKQIIDIKVEDAIFLGGTATANTNALATTISTQPGFNENNLQSPTAHSALANIAVSIPTTTSLATLIIEGNTASSSFSKEPLFARSFVYGNATSTNYLLPTTAGSALKINWQFEKYQIQNNPAVSFSEITDTLRVSTQYVSIQSGLTVGEKVSNSFSFTNSIENNHFVSSLFPESNTNEFNIQGSFPEIVMPLTAEIDHFLMIEIEHIHTEYTIEAPATATNIIDAAAGNKGNDETVKMFWDPDAEMLSFSRIPIDVLNNGIGNGLQTKYIDDPLNGGYIEIDPLSYLETEDGNSYFEGDEIRLIDKFGNTLLKASLPTLVFDDDLYDLNGFNFFAPLLNILDVNLVDSLWLKDYFEQGGLDTLLLNELFIGVDTEGFFWDQRFEAPVIASLSYTGFSEAKIPEPMMLILFLIGLIMLIVNYSYMQKRLRG